MTMREGSLEAPTRHPLAWRTRTSTTRKSFAKLERVFDICHGCRRCVNLCTAFPTAVRPDRRGTTGELDGVDKASYWKVVDHCYLCDTCYMTKCPYVPPHPWNVDFPHVCCAPRRSSYKRGDTFCATGCCQSTDAVGKLATIPVVVQMVNAANKHRVRARRNGKGARRAQGPRAAGVRERNISARLRRPTASFPVRDGKTTPGKVAIFATCYVNYNEPGHRARSPEDPRAQRNPAVIVDKEACCGMPKLELGDLEAVAG